VASHALVVMRVAVAAHKHLHLPLAEVTVPLATLGRRVTDINVFVRPSRRNAEREAVGLARMRQQVKAGKLKVAWMSEEEKAAYRLQEAPEGGATVASDPGEYRRKEALPAQLWPR
jgi:hypothetical protein